MNPKLLLAFLGGLLAATGVFYVQSHRSAAVEPAKVEPAPVVAAAPVETPAPAPEPPAVPPPVKPTPVKPAPKKKVVAPAEQPAPIEQAKVEAPPAPEPPPPPPPVEPKPEPPQPQSVTITSGTLIAVRLSEVISSERNRPGDSFVAALDQPLVVDGLVIAEKGARATGRVVDALEAGRVKGLARLSIELTSVLLSDGQKIDLRTARFVKEGEASKTEDAQKVGIGAAIGAAIGAIAGGGKGAAIGAATGGAAGGGVVAATRGKPAVLPAETKISFRLDQPVSITEQR